MFAPWKISHDKRRERIKKQRHHFADKGPYSETYGFSSSHEQMWELVHTKVEHQRIDAFEWCCCRRLSRVPWTAEIKPDNPKGSQPWIFIGRTNDEAGAPILWLLDMKHRVVGKDPHAGIDWRQKKGVTEEEVVRSIADSVDINFSKLWELVEDREAYSP